MLVQEIVVVCCDDSEYIVFNHSVRILKDSVGRDSVGILMDSVRILVDSARILFDSIRFWKILLDSVGILLNY